MIKQKFINVLTLIAFVCATAFPFSYATAAPLTAASDTMTNENVSSRSDHTFAWTQAAGSAYVASDSITIKPTTSTDFVASGSWATSDFVLTVAGIGSTTPVYAASSAGTCTAGAGNYGVVYTNASSQFVINLCPSFGTATTAGAVSFKIKGATGTGLLTNRATAAPSLPWTIVNAGSNTDSTTVAAVVVTNDVVTVTATVNPTLTFSLGSNTVALGTLSSGSTGSGTHTINVATNAGNGFTVTYNGPTLTGPGGTIPAYGTLQPSAAGTPGFGFNLKDTGPTTNAGATCTPATNYNTASSYSYVASTTTPVTNMSAAADCTFTATYKANISNITPAGAYSAAIVYIASASF